MILIDGVATVEPDIATCHPRLLCVLAGLDLPFHEKSFDFYAELGRNVPTSIDRDLIKTAFGIMICAPTKLSAIRAWAQELRIAGLGGGHKFAERTLSAMSEAMPRLERYFFTGIGLRLQNMDAQICANIQGYCRQRGIVCLSIHDGFRVRSEDNQLVEELMEEEVSAMCKRAWADL